MSAEPTRKQAWTLHQETIDRLVSGFLSFNEWVPARKLALAYALSVPLQLLIMISFEVLLADIPAYSLQLLRVSAWIWFVFVCIALGLCSIWAVRGNPTSLPVYINVFGYGGFAIYHAYLYGTMDSVWTSFFFIMAAGNYILFGWRAAVMMVCYWMIVTLLLGIAQIQNWLPFAPAFVDRLIDVRNDPGWFAQGFLFLLSAVLFFLIVIGLTVAARQHAERALQHSRGLIRRYVPPAVANRIIAGEEAEIDTPQRQRLTVFFSDVVGFTDVADRVEPEVITQVINEYLSAMSKIVDAHGGTLNEFSGDGIMALFGAPESMEPRKQVHQAVDMALAMQRDMAGLNENWRELGLGEELQVRMGINTGMLSVGSFGSQGRMTYTAIGLQTNVTARIQAQCQPGKILLSDASWQLIREEVQCTAMGEIEVKGVHFPIKVYEVESMAR
jgi:class 3 adenylate cyclase